MKFKDPTPEELEEFEKNYVAPPKPVETKAEEVSGPSDIGDFLKGTAQGATLGFGDELLAAIQATVSPEQKSWLERYRQKQKENEAAYQEAQERSPWLTGIGELAGGFALPVGTALKGAKAAEAAIGSKALQEALTAGKTAEEAAELAQKAKNLFNLKSAAKTGATIGGITGLGTSEGTIEETPGKLASDVATGAAFGGAFGGAASKLGSSASEYIKESPNIQRALRAMNLEFEGVNLGTEKGQRFVNEKVENATNDISDSLLKTWESVSKDLNEKISPYANATPSALFHSIIKNPNSSGAQLRHILRNNKTLTNVFKQFSDLRQAANSNQLTKWRTDTLTRRKVPVGSINISDLLNLKDEIRTSLSRERLNRPELFSDPVEIEELQKIPQLVDDVLKSMGSSGEDILKAYETKARMAYPIEALLNDSADDAAHGIKIRDIWKDPKNLDQKNRLVKKLRNAISGNIEYSAGTGSEVVKNKEFLKDLTTEFDKRLKDSIQTSPQLEVDYLDNNIMSPDKMLGRFKEAYEDLGAMQSSEGMRRAAEKTIGKEAAAAVSSGITGLPISFGEETITSIGGKLGRLGSKLPVTKTRDLIKTYGVDKLKSMADTLRNSNIPVAKNLGESAMTSLERGDAASRAAFINSVMQHPDLRKILDLQLDKD